MDDLAMGVLLGATGGLVVVQIAMVYYQRKLLAARRRMLGLEAEAVMWEFLSERYQARLTHQNTLCRKVSGVLREIAFDAHCESDACEQARRLIGEFEDMLLHTSFHLPRAENC